VSVISALWATLSILAMVLRASHAVLRTVYALSFCLAAKAARAKGKAPSRSDNSLTS